MTDCIFIKQSNYSEYIMQTLIYNAISVCKKSRKIVNIPKVYLFNETDNTLQMQKIPHMCLSDYYGEDWNDLPIEIQQNIKKIIKTLYLKGYIYPDITGYNFIELDKKIWIIDFEHAFVFSGNIFDLTKEQLYHYKFVKKFISDDEIGWNQYFK
jgi:tRNA A-37 threonylcarbamoyl transferase component Bud32